MREADNFRSGVLGLTLRVTRSQSNPMLGGEGFGVDTLAVAPWSDGLAAGALTFPDFVLHRLARAGIGRVDAEWSGSERMAVARLVPRLVGEPTELARVPGGPFRTALAGWARRAGLANPYCGHALFAVEPHPGWPPGGLYRFSLFLCNEPAMGIWFRVYLYCIDGVWPTVSGGQGPEPSAPADRCGVQVLDGE